MTSSDKLNQNPTEKKGKNGAKGMSLKDAAHTITTRKKCRDPEINWKGV